MLATTMVTEILDDLHDTSLGTAAYRWINVAQEMLNDLGYWTHLESRIPYQFSFVAPYTTGTVSVSADGTTVTGSGTAWTSALHAGQVIVFYGNENVYYIASVESTTSLTLNVAFIGTTLAAATYTIHTVNYALPSVISLPKIKDVCLQNPWKKLEFIEQRRRDKLAPNLLAATGAPWGYLDWGQSHIQPYPYPDAKYIATVRYQYKPTDVSASQTTFDWPDTMHRCIARIALGLGWKHKDDTNADAVLAEGMAMGRSHWAAQSAKGDSTRRQRPFDESSGLMRWGIQLGRRING